MQLQAVQKAVQAGDAQALHRAAHTIKGSLAGFSAPSAADAAEALDKIGQTGDLGRAEMEYERLESEVQRVTEALQRLRAQTDDVV